MSHRAIVLTAAAAVLSAAGLPAMAEAHAAQAAPIAGPMTNAVPGRSGVHAAAVVQPPPRVHATTAASGAPAISSRTPASGATAVVRTTNLKVRFTKAVKASSIVIRLRDYATGKYLAGKLTYASATRYATFNPTPTLGSHRKYVVVVSGAKDSAGNTMTKSTWTFTTRP
jgi:hypothetical protein